MHNNMSHLAPWTLPCSPQPARHWSHWMKVRSFVHSLFIHIIPCPYPRMARHDLHTHTHTDNVSSFDLMPCTHTHIMTMCTGRQRRHTHTQAEQMRQRPAPCIVIL
jgi:hypothetical protein